jgi:hypothetical protein
MATQFSICLWHKEAKEMATYYQGVFTDFKLISENPLVVVFEINAENKEFLLSFCTKSNELFFSR